MSEYTQKFIQVLVRTVKSFTGLRDMFFARRLYEKLSDLINSFILFSAQSEKRPETNVAQYKCSKNLAVSVKSLRELLECLAYLHLGDETSLLHAQRNLLELEQLMLVSIKSQFRERSEEKKTAVHTSTSVQSKIFKPIPLRLNVNKQKILELIKSTPNIRAKEIIENFNLLSERTVKRNLKELTGLGLLEKKMKDRAVYYLVHDTN